MPDLTVCAPLSSATLSCHMRGFWSWMPTHAEPIAFMAVCLAGAALIIHLTTPKMKG